MEGMPKPSEEEEKSEVAPEKLESELVLERERLEDNVHALSANVEKAGLLSEEQGAKLAEFLERNMWAQVGALLPLLYTAQSALQGRELNWTSVAIGVGVGAVIGKGLDIALHVLGKRGIKKVFETLEKDWEESKRRDAEHQ